MLTGKRYRGTFWNAGDVLYLDLGGGETSRPV